MGVRSGVSSIYRSLGVCLVILMLSACQKEVTLAPLAADARILAFGDSLTYGLGALPEEAYPVILETLTRHEVINAGVSGETTAEGLKRLPVLLGEYEPALVIICLGANDFLRSLSEELAAANIRAMVRLAQERGAGVLLIAVPKFGLLKSPPEFYASIAQEFGIPLESLTLAEIIRSPGKMADLVHPNGAGYRMLAQALFVKMQQAGAIK